MNAGKAKAISRPGQRWFLHVGQRVSGCLAIAAAAKPEAVGDDQKRRVDADELDEPDKQIVDDVLHGNSLKG